jgi:hypothetical protein
METLAFETGEYHVVDTGSDVTIAERIHRIPNTHGYGHHNEHHATTRSRALARVRELVGSPITLTSAHVEFVSGSEWRVYYIETVQS